MKRNCALLTALLTLTALPAQGGYRVLRRELQNYRPPVLYRQALKPAPQKAPPREAEPTEFRAEVRRLQQLKSTHLQALETPSAQDFYRPAPKHLARLQKAAATSDLALKMLAGPFALEDLEILVYLRNPDIQAAHARALGALEAYSQVANLDEILRQYAAFTAGVMPGIGPMKGESISMNFPFPGVLALKGDIATQEVKMARERLEIARRQALTRTRLTYWNLLYNQRARQVTGQTLDLLRRLESVATTRYETGETSFQDLVRVRINRETMEEALTTLREQAGTLKADLLALVDLPPGTAVGAPLIRKPEAAPPPLAKLYELAMANRQEIRLMEARVDKMSRMIEMAETMILPDFSLDFSFYENQAIRQTGTAASKETFATSTRAARGAGLPQKSFYGTNDAYLARTRQELRAVRAELEQLRNTVRAETRAAWSAYDQARRERDLYARSVVDLSQTALDVATRGYESGKVAFADVIGSYTTWLNANLTLARKKSDLGITVSELKKTVGISWP